MSRRTAEDHDRYAHQILSEIEAGRPVSQRSLAGSLGIALGLTNLLLRRLIRKGWVRASKIRANRVGYFLTPTGIAEKSRMSHAYFQDSVRFYASARDRLRERFAELPSKAVVFLGTGEVAEIAYVCLQETDVRLAGVVDFQGRERFFGVPVCQASAFTSDVLTTLAGDDGVLVAFNDSEQVRTFLETAGIPAGRVHWIF